MWPHSTHWFGFLAHWHPPIAHLAQVFPSDGSKWQTSPVLSRVHGSCISVSSRSSALMKSKKINTVRLQLHNWCDLKSSQSFISLLYKRFWPLHFLHVEPFWQTIADSWFTSRYAPDLSNNYTVVAYVKFALISWYLLFSCFLFGQWLATMHFVFSYTAISNPKSVVILRNLFNFISLLLLGYED